MRPEPGNWFYLKKSTATSTTRTRTRRRDSDDDEDGLPTNRARANSRARAYSSPDDDSEDRDDLFILSYFIYGPGRVGGGRGDLAGRALSLMTFGPLKFFHFRKLV